MTASTPSFTMRHVALGRALFAAIAAVMITFTSDHSAEVGLSVFSGFAVATSIVWACAAWLVVPAGQRSAPIVLAVISLACGVVAGMIAYRTALLFLVLVVVWAVVSGVTELLWGLSQRRAGVTTFVRDAITVGSITLLLALATVIVPINYQQPYQVAGNDYLLTGTTIMVGVFGGYAAIIAVYEAIAGLTPKRAETPDAVAAEAGEVQQ